MKIELTTPACPLKDEIEGNVHSALSGLGATEVTVTWGAMVRRAQPAQAQQLLPGVKNIIAVASGKGGVGKSTISANLAVALAMEGATVGLLDADITGPNIPLMLGVEGAPAASSEGKITPLERYGVKVISIQFFVPEGQPIVWRGPLVGGAIQQFLRDVDWGELDYLVIDLPPGTSDAQLTLGAGGPDQRSRAGHDAAGRGAADVAKALAMFRRMSVPVMGIVENMSTFVCPHCGEVTEIFGRGGGRAIRPAQRDRVLRRRADRRQGSPGRRRRRARGRPARAGRGGRGAARAGTNGRGAYERPRRASRAGDHDQLTGFAAEPLPQRGGSGNAARRRPSICPPGSATALHLLDALHRERCAMRT